MTKWKYFLCGQEVPKYSDITNHLEKHSKDNNTLYESIYQQWRRNLKNE
jgi:hypothetical protein